MTRGNTGAAQFAAAVLTLVRGDRGPDAEWTDYATVQADGALLCDRFRRPFPLGSYYALDLWRAVPGDAWPLDQTGPAEGGGGDGHTHGVGRPSWLGALRPGDRVVVVWTNDGVDPLVVGRAVRVDAVAAPGGAARFTRRPPRRERTALRPGLAAEVGS